MNVGDKYSEYINATSHTAEVNACTTIAINRGQRGYHEYLYLYADCIKADLTRSQKDHGKV